VRELRELWRARCRREFELRGLGITCVRGESARWCGDVEVTAAGALSPAVCTGVGEVCTDVGEVRWRCVCPELLLVFELLWVFGLRCTLLILWLLEEEEEEEDGGHSKEGSSDRGGTSE
jgi:hypothetical protein